MTCIIVLGCYRSGTSAIAGVLHHLGVPMGKQFDPPTRNNMLGYWEDIEFKNFHTQFDLGRESKNPELTSMYENLIKQREAEYSLWGIKDPLLCTNLTRFISGLSHDYKLIVCRRHVDDIAHSMAKSLDSDMSFLQVANFYTNSMNNQLKNYDGPILELNHNETMFNPRTTVDKIASYVSLPVNEAAYNHIVKT